MCIRDRLEARIAEEKLAKPKVTEEFIRFWLLRFRKLDKMCIRDRLNEGALVERTGLKVGLRKFELKERQMLLNGKRIVFKGCLLYTSIPVLIVFLSLQKYFVQGVASTGIKG